MKGSVHIPHTMTLTLVFFICAFTPLMPMIQSVARGAQAEFAPQPALQAFPDEPVAEIGKGYPCATRFTLDGRYLAVGTSTNITRLFSTEDWSEAAILDGGDPFDFRISDKHLELASHSYDGRIRLFDVDDNISLGTLGLGRRRLISMSFSHDGKLLALGGEELTLWDVEEGVLAGVLDAEWVCEVAFSPDDRLLGLGLCDGELQIWDATAGKMLADLDRESERIKTVAFSPDSKHLAAGSWNGSVKVWDVDTARLVTTLRSPSNKRAIQEMDFSSGGELLAAGQFDGTVEVWDTRTWDQVSTMEGPDGLCSISFSHDSELLAMAGRYEVRIFDPRSMRKVHSISDFSRECWALAFSPDGKLIAAGHNVWKTESLELVYTFEGRIRIQDLAFSPDGQFLAYADRDIKLWNTSTWTEFVSIPLTAWVWVRSLAFSPDGKFLALGLDDKGASSVRIVTVPNMREVRDLRSQGLAASSVAFSPDGELLASGSWHYSVVKIWDMNTYKLDDELKGHDNEVSSVTFSPDGKVLASGSYDGTVKLWEVETGKLLNTLDNGSHWVMCLSFSPNGRFLAAGSIRVGPVTEHSVQIWDVEDGELVAEFDGLRGYTRAISFSPDGKLLALGSQAGTVSLWEMPSSAWGTIDVGPEGMEISSWGSIKRNELFQNYPNPFNPDTWIPYQLIEESEAAIIIYDATGQMVRTLDLGHKDSGYYISH